MHVDTTSFSVNGQYTQTTAAAREEQTEVDSAIVAITYGYSRDHREDLKQWMLARASTHDGDIPLFLRPLDGNSSGKESLLMAITALQDQLRQADGEPSAYVANNGIGSRVQHAAVVRSWSQVGQPGLGDLDPGSHDLARRLR